MKKEAKTGKKEGEEEDDESNKSRHKLRNLIDDEKLKKETQQALNAENERKKRLEEKRKLEQDLENSKKSDSLADLFLDIDPETKTSLIQVDKNIVVNLKSHQIDGLKFMWDSCFEKVEMIKEGHKGSGCILAHCMGLGKTLQVVSLVHTLLANSDDTKVKRVLILMPVNVVLNWRNEFQRWTKKCDYQVKVYDLSNEEKGKDIVRNRINIMQRWFDKGGVLLLGFTLFARLAQGQGIKQKQQKDKLAEFMLKPGADLVIVDEGHVLKTEKTNIAKSVCQVETLRRIILTGTPLQNNLVEYHCMISFVKPNLLGTLKEFKNRFANPISNGQHRDSTDLDVRYMKKRVHVLHNLLDGCVQRKDYGVIKKQLLPKYEYVLSVRLSEAQINLYRSYLVGQRSIMNTDTIGKIQGTQFFIDFQILSRIWSHPWMLRLQEKRDEKKRLKDSTGSAKMREWMADEEDIDDDAKSDEICLDDEEEKETDSDIEITTIKPKK